LRVHLLALLLLSVDGPYGEEKKKREREKKAPSSTKKV